MPLRPQRQIFRAVRIALGLACSVAFPDLPHFEGKGVAFRAPFDLLPTGVVPLVWTAGRRRTRTWSTRWWSPRSSSARS